ncbi:MAG: hypothetical protein U7127_00875 [Phormidium sp.]
MNQTESRRLSEFSSMSLSVKAEVFAIYADSGIIQICKSTTDKCSGTKADRQIKKHSL